MSPLFLADRMELAHGFLDEISKTPHADRVQGVQVSTHEVVVFVRSASEVLSGTFDGYPIRSVITEATNAD